MDQGISVGNRFRLTSHVLLGLVIAIGNLPAWMHAGTCSHDHATSDVCHAVSHRCCKNQAGDTLLDAAVQGPPSTNTETPHDLTHCILCQSLGGRESGMVAGCDLTIHRSMTGIACLHTARSPRLHSCSIPRPRGPPFHWA